MSLSLAQFINNNAGSIQELIGTTAMEVVPTQEAIFKDMILSSMGVMPASEIGRDMLIKRRFYGSYAGVMRGGAQTNNVALYGDNQLPLGATGSTTADAGAGAQNLSILQAGTAVPNALESAVGLPYGLTSRLYSQDGNFPIPLAMLEADAMAANIREHVASLIRGVGENLSNWMANSFFADSANQYRLCTLPATLSAAAASGANIDTTHYTIRFAPVEKNAGKVAAGMQVDIVDSSGNVKNVNDAGTYRARLFVQSSNPATNEITLVATTGTKAGEGDTTATFATWATAAALQGCNLVYANTGSALTTASFQGMYGWRDWMKFSALPSDAAADRRLLGSNAITTDSNDFIDVSMRPEFRSMKFSSVGALTQSKLLAHFETIHAEFDRFGHLIDTLMAAPGIWLNVFDGTLPATRYVQQNAPKVSNLMSLGLEDGFEINAYGRIYKGYTSRRLEDGLILGMRRQNNWEMVVPPDPRGTTRQAQGLMAGKVPVVFVMPALGMPGPAFPILDPTTGRPTYICQYPFYVRCQFQPRKQVRGVLWSGVNSTRIFAG